MMRKASLFAALLLALALAVPGAIAVTDSNTYNADIYVEQPHYVDTPVNTVEDNSTVVYEARGGQLELGPRNFTADDVIDYGIKGDDGQLQYDEDKSRFIFDAESIDGTYKVWFEVREDVEYEVEVEEGNETVTETRTDEVENQYEAVLSVEDTGFAHKPSEEIDELRDDADRWDEWERNVQGLYDRTVDVDRYTEIAFAFLVYVADPLEALTGGYVGVWMMLIMEPGGILVGLTILLVVVILAGGYIRYGNMRAARDAAQQRLEEKKKEIERDAIESALATTPVTNVYSNPDVAEMLMDALDSENVLDAWETLRNDVFDEAELLADRLAAMKDAGYVVEETGDSLTVTDDPSGENRDIDDLSEDEISELADDVVVRRFSLVDAEPSTTSLNVDLDELDRRIDKDLDHVGGREAFAEYLADLMMHIQQHDVTDTDSQVKDLRYVLEQLLRLTQEAEAYDAPEARYYYEHLLYLHESHDVSAEVQEDIEDARKGGGAR